MAKLVLYLPDGSLHDILLDKERLTIGRRPDNDICLPYPAVSGEHAVVVTILADSFLEDLGSTNGTLVNGKPVAKHFLRENDHIDIGRQRLVYFSRDDTQAVPLLPDALRHEVRGLHEQVQRVRQRREEQRTPAAKPASPPSADALAIDEDLFADIESSAAQDDASGPRESGAGAERPGRPGGDAGAAGRPIRHTSTVASRLASTWTPDPPPGPAASAATDAASGAVQVEVPPADRSEAEPLTPSYRVRVLSGPSEGREMVLNRPQVSIGRVGTQVAAVTARGGAWWLSTLDGTAPLELNGQAVPAGGSTLAPGDRFRVAGTDLVFEER